MSDRLEQLLQEAAKDTLETAELAYQIARSGRYHACMDIVLGALLILFAIGTHQPLLGLGVIFVLYGGLHLRHWHLKVVHWAKRVAHWKRWIREVGDVPDL